MSVSPSEELIYDNRILTPFQKMAERKEEFIMLKAGLAEYPVAAIEQALKVLRLDALYRSERCLGVAEWLAELHYKTAAVKDERLRDNVVWRAVASAPPGFCHIRSTMIATLLEDIIYGMSFDEISSRFAAKMHPLQYQRPQEPPSAENIAQAEKIVSRMNAAGSLARRFARIEELRALWRPAEAKPEEEQPKGVFSHLKPGVAARAVRNIEVPPITVTWEKFLRTALPSAAGIEFEVPVNKMNYGAIVTAVNADAPPILQWDSEEQRNPFSWYVYPDLSLPENWNLTPGMAPVTAICFKPPMWFSPQNFRHQGEGVFLILSAAMDKRDPGAAIFPETIKSEFHPVRATVEAYSRQATMEGRAEATACGLMLVKGERWQGIRLVVTDNDGGLTLYDLDRWD